MNNTPDPSNYYQTTTSSAASASATPVPAAAAAAAYYQQQQQQLSNGQRGSLLSLRQQQQQAPGISSSPSPVQAVIKPPMWPPKGSSAKGGGGTGGTYLALPLYENVEGSTGRNKEEQPHMTKECCWFLFLIILLPNEPCLELLSCSKAFAERTRVRRGRKELEKELHTLAVPVLFF